MSQLLVGVIAKTRHITTKQCHTAAKCSKWIQCTKYLAVDLKIIGFDSIENSGRHIRKLNTDSKPVRHSVDYIRMHMPNA